MRVTKRIEEFIRENIDAKAEEKIKELDQKYPKDSRSNDIDIDNVLKDENLCKEVKDLIEKYAKQYAQQYKLSHNDQLDYYVQNIYVKFKSWEDRRNFLKNPEAEMYHQKCDAVKTQAKNEIKNIILKLEFGEANLKSLQELLNDVKF